CLVPLPFSSDAALLDLPSFPTRRSSDLTLTSPRHPESCAQSPKWSSCRGSSAPSPAPRRLPRWARPPPPRCRSHRPSPARPAARSEEHTSELQSRENLVCRLLLENKKKP